MHAKARIVRLERLAQGRAHLSEQEAIRWLRDILMAAGNGTPAPDIPLPDLGGTRAGAFLEALAEVGRCAV